MATVYSSSDPVELLSGMRAARNAVVRGEPIVIPTDTLYGIAVDAFSPQAVTRLLESKGRTRQSPPPVLVADMAAMRALVAEVPTPVQRLADAFWPGALTVVLKAQPALAWDLGDTAGTVAVRIPDNSLTIELLRDTGPLATSSANRTGHAPAVNVQQAVDALGESVDVFIDGGEVAGEASTIIDATGLRDGMPIRILREGAISREQLTAVVGADIAPEDEAVAAPEHSADEADGADEHTDDVDGTVEHVEPAPRADDAAGTDGEAATESDDTTHTAPR